MQGSPIEGHNHPVSIKQLDEHPSPEIKLESSQFCIELKEVFPHGHEVISNE